MPELPDVTVYVESLRERVLGQRLQSVRIAHPFVLRSFAIAADASVGKTVREVSRLGKRIVISLSDDLFWLIHLMIAGRLRWEPHDTKIPKKLGLAAFDFGSGTLLLTEAGTARRASLHLVRGEDELLPFRRDGVGVFEVDQSVFASSLRRENHTLKRALTDPDVIDGIGNAYSDEILHAARLSPVIRTQSLDDEGCARLYAACRKTLAFWIELLRAEASSGFPVKVTAFRPEMSVHGRFGQPCPVCGTKVQRIRYASNESNYCPTCQTGGRLLADRGLSRLLGKDWPRSLEELEERRAQRRIDP